MGRTLSVDYGERRIGLAVTDPTGTIATPYDTLQRRRGKRPPWKALLGVVEEMDVDTLVIGLPLAPEGGETDWTREVRDFGTRLEELSGLPVEWIDERMTSGAAERIIRTSDLRKSQREDRSRVDATAAAIILQAYLAQRTR